MAKWYPAFLAIAAGLCAAIAAALDPAPVVAFFAAAIATLAAAMLVRTPPAPEADRRVETAPAADPLQQRATPMPLGFGRALIEMLPTPLLVVTRSGVIAYANPAAHAALPRLRTGEHFAHLIRAPAFVEAVNATFADGNGRSLRFSARLAGDQSLEATTGLLPPGPAFGPEAMAIVQIEDRTEARRAEELRSDFIANASHELRTPLASIVGYIETLQHHAREDPEARERFLGIMAREAGRMQRLVDDLMSLSRIEMTEHVRPDEAWSLNRIASESAASLVPIAEREGVTLKVDLPAEGATVLCDRDQLTQVFTNLIDNAMKYGGRGSTVQLQVAAPNRAHPNRCGVTVVDDGPGIAREHLSRLTERFYRVSVAGSRRKGGTGLGLAIVKHILNRHQGRLEIASAPGKGSAFTVWLPPAATASRAAPPDAA